MRPTRTMISPIQKLQKIIRTIPTITMIPPREMPAGLLQNYVDREILGET